MKTYPKKRIDIMVETPLMKRVINILDQKGVSGYTVLPVLAGKGQDGAWHRDGLVGRAGTLVNVFCIVDESRVDDVVDAVFSLVEKQIGIVTVCDVQVIRPAQF